MTSATDTAHRREALRQQLLLRVLWRDADSGVPQGHARPLGAHALKAGVAAYRGNAGAVAERALAGTFPTLAELVGDDAAGALARDFWRHHPPARGDLAEWGDALPGFVAASAQLADEPYLADVARLEWQVHLASRAADAPTLAPDLQVLAGADPSRLRLRLTPGTASGASAAREARCTCHSSRATSARKGSSASWALAAMNPGKASPHCARSPRAGGCWRQKSRASASAVSSPTSSASVGKVPASARAATAPALPR